MSKHFLYPNWLCCHNQQGGVQARVHPVAPPRSWFPNHEAWLERTAVLPYTHARAASPWKHIGECQAHRFYPEAGVGLETTRDRTLTHNLETRKLSGFDMVQEEPPQPLSWARGTANRPLLAIATSKEQ